MADTAKPAPQQTAPTSQQGVARRPSATARALPSPPNKTPKPRPLPSPPGRHAASKSTTAAPVPKTSPPPPPQTTTTTTTKTPNRRPATQAPATAAAEAKGQEDKSPLHKRQASVPPGETATASKAAPAASPLPSRAKQEQQEAKPEEGDRGVTLVKPPKKEAKQEEFVLGDSRRDMIVYELLTTERTYVEMLQIAVDQFLVPLKRDDGAAVLPADKVSTIFSNITDILQMNTLVLGDLEERMRRWGPAQCIGDVLLKLSPFFRIYTAYVSNFDHASATLEECEKLPAFAAFLRQRLQSEECKGQTLRSFLILPVQRVPRYRLLVEDLVKNTPESHPDHKQLVECLDKISEVAADINEAIRKHENRLKVLAIQQRINTLICNVNIFEPHRVFVREGTLWKVCRKAPKKREFFLFNDLFFYASQLPTGSLFVHRVIKLVELRLADVMDTDTTKNAFQVGSTQKSFVVFAETKEEKVDWMVDLTNFMESCRKNSQSLQLENAVDTSKLSEAPVWQPDSEVTCCPMCSIDFTLLNRRHHCRSCGKVVCRNCSAHKLILPIARTPQRVCDMCYKEFQTYRAQKAAGAPAQTQQ